MADYDLQWRQYRALRTLAVGVPIVGLIAVKCASLFPAGWQLKVVVGVGAVFFAVAIVVAIGVETWRCPRCGRRFVSKWMSGWAIFFTKKCSNCGLPKFGNGEAPKS
jgi:hypothetical protein